MQEKNYASMPLQRAYSSINLNKPMSVNFTFLHATAAIYFTFSGVPAQCTGVEVLISPLHDKDVNPDGSPKKAHWHVMVMFSSVKTKKQAAVIRDAVGGVGWENVASARGYARYLCHLDNPEKHRYDENDVVEMGGADYQETIRRVADGVRLLREMMDYIRENNVYFYSDFVDYCNAEKPEWFEAIVTRYTYTVYTYIKARGKKLDRMERWGVDPDTGEVR